MGTEMEVLTPDQLMGGGRPRGNRVVVFDDDHYYMGGAMAELLLKEGYSVALVTPEPEVSSWTHMTLEQHRIQAHLLDLGAEVIVAHSVTGATASGLVLQSVYTRSEQAVECDSTVFVTSRLPNETLYLELLDCQQDWAEAGLLSVRTVGDALSPGTIASAVWDGRRFAEDLGRAGDDAWFPRDIAVV